MRLKGRSRESFSEHVLFKQRPKGWLRIRSKMSEIASQMDQAGW